MKRLLTRLLTAVLAVSILASLAVGASAIELKTGIGIVESNGLRLRAKPSTDAEILANASYGDNVVIIREVDGWYLVDYNLQIGYMSAEYITFKERENIDLGYGVVEDASVNLRSTPDTNGELLATLTTGETAYIIGLNCGWYKVQYEGQTGYIRSDLLALTEPPAGTPRPTWARALPWSSFRPSASRSSTTPTTSSALPTSGAAPPPAALTAPALPSMSSSRWATPSSAPRPSS